MRRVRTRVFPDPAPARIASGDASVVTASRWVSSRSSSSGSAARAGPVPGRVPGVTDAEAVTARTVPAGCDGNADAPQHPDAGKRQVARSRRQETRRAPSSLCCKQLRTSRGPVPSSHASHGHRSAQRAHPVAQPPLGRDTLASVSVVPPAPGSPKVPVPRPTASDPSPERFPKVASGLVPSRCRRTPI